jgi:Glycosyl hydrolases family 18
MAEVSELWQELQWILEQLSVLLDAEGLLPASTTAVGLPTMLAGLIESALPVAVLPSAPIEVSSPSITDAVAFATTIPMTAMASTSLQETASANFPKVTYSLAGSATVPSMIPVAATIFGLPGSARSSSPDSEAMATFRLSPASSEASSFTDMTLATEGSICYATQTIDETTTVSQLAVTASEATATSVSTTPDSTFTSTARNNISSAVGSPNGGVFVATSVGSGPSSTGTSSYTFDSQSTQNIAVYYGQSGATGGSTLEDQCADPNIDIVILAFVITRNYEGKYPNVNFGAACGGQTSEMMTQAPGLLSCPQLEDYIDICQQTYGKKVLLSIGGSASSLSFPSASDASDFANTLWQLFGPPGSLDIQLRPFGNVSIDGFDVGKSSNLH